MAQAAAAVRQHERSTEAQAPARSGIRPPAAVTARQPGNLQVQAEHAAGTRRPPADGAPTGPPSSTGPSAERHAGAGSPASSGDGSDHPVQALCAACEAENAATMEPAVQRWDCGEFTAPTCVQTRDHDDVADSDTVQPMCAECEAETQDTTQSQAEPAAGDGAASAPQPVQAQCEECEAETKEATQSRAESTAGDARAPAVQPVQAQCADFEVETQGAMQAKADSATADAGASAVQPVQAQCAECEAETQDTTQSQADSAAGSDGASAGQPVQARGDGSDDGPLDSSDAVQPAVQLWDCSEFTAPVCVQTRDATVSPALQKAAAPDSVRSPSHIHREARRGLRDAIHPLPHGERIQQAFGRHDISHVRANVGGEADAASRRMGALAFASGDRIGFRQSPDVHLAAHEAAHVVQQRAGLRLPGAIGRAGDRYERHADRVADAVKGGRSAEALLDEVAPSSRAASGGEARAPVQQRFTSSPVHVSEAPPRTAPAQPAATQGEGKAGGRGTPGAGANAGNAPGNALAEAAQGGPAEAPPEGITIGGAPGGGGGAAPGGGSTSGGTGSSGGVASAPGAPAADARPAEPASAGPGGNLCYNVAPPPRPESTEEPSSDERSAESREEPRVTFDAWVDTPDACPAQAALQQGAQQIPQGIGTAPAGGAGAGPAAGAGMAMPAKAAQSAEAAPAQRPGGGAPQESGPVASEGGASASAESGRDTAVADFDAASSALDGVLSRAQSLEAGTIFAPGGEGTQREQSTEQVRAFMRRAGAQITGAVAFAREQVPARLGAVAESAMASLQAAMEAEKAGVSARIAQARAQARGAAQRARGHVHAQYAVSVATVVAETSAALATLATQHAAAVPKVEQKQTRALEDVITRFARGRTRHEEKGPDYSRRAIARAQVYVQSYESCKGDYSDDGFWDGCLTVRRAKAQQDAACKTAAGYNTGFLRTANKKGYDLLPLRTQYRCAVIAGGRQVIKTLDDTYDKLVEGLERGQAQAIEGLGGARAQNLAAIDTALAASLRALGDQEHTQRQAVNDAGYASQLGVEQLAHASAANLARGVGAAMDSLDRSLGELRGRFGEAASPPPDTLTEVLAQIDASLSGGMGSFLGTMDTGTATAQANIAQTGAAGVGGLAQIGAENNTQSAAAEAGFATQMGGLMAGATGAFTQLTSNHVDRARQSATEGTTAMKSAVSAFDDSLSTIRERIDGAISSSLEGLDTELAGTLAQLDGQIEREAWKAAEKEQPAWKKVVAIVLIILVVILAAVISIATLGAGASLFAVILVGALVGAVSAGLIQILNNWASGEAWHTGLVQAVVMGAIGGAIGGGLGFAGGALAAGAAQVGARVVTQLAITVTADLVAEGLTQTIGYFAFGQQFNWQGFVMAGAMSGVSFRAHPATPHPPAAHAPTAHAPSPHAPTPHGGAPHAEAPHASAPHAEGPHASAPHPEAPAPHAAAPDAAPPPRPAADAPPARAGSPETAAPRAPAPTRAAGAAAARRAAVTQIAGGAAVGLLTEVATSAITGERLDPARLASAAASAAVAARIARMGHGRATHGEPTTRTPGALDRFRRFDPGGHGARLTERLEGLGARLASSAGESAGPASSRPAPGEGVVRPSEETPARAAPGTDETHPIPRPTGEEPGGGTPPRRTAEEPAPGGRRSGARDEELAGPARRMSDSDLAEATNQRMRVNGEDHDVRIRREGAEVCSACDLMRGRVNALIESLPPGPPRERVERLRELVRDVDTRLAAGESGVNMVRDSARIAEAFRALALDHPTLGRALEQPSLLQTRTPSGDLETPAHLRALAADVVRTEAMNIRDFSSSTLARGEQGIYILRDSGGAILKVGIAESGPGRFSKYLTAANNLGLDVRIEIAVVTPRAGTSLVDIEGNLRTRLEHEGHVLPWDNATRAPGDRVGRLGRTGQGTPFVRKSHEAFAWTREGERIAIPETVARLRVEGRTDAEIIEHLTTHTTLTRANATKLITTRFRSQIEAAEAALRAEGSD